MPLIKNMQQALARSGTLRRLALSSAIGSSRTISFVEAMLRPEVGISELAIAVPTAVRVGLNLATSRRSLVKS